MSSSNSSAAIRAHPQRISEGSVSKRFNHAVDQVSVLLRNLHHRTGQKADMNGSEDTRRADHKDHRRAQNRGHQGFPITAKVGCRAEALAYQEAALGAHRAWRASDPTADRFSIPQKLLSYFGLHPPLRVRDDVHRGASTAGRRFPMVLDRRSVPRPVLLMSRK